MLADLATLAAVAGWPAPTSIAEHQHAGAAGHRLGRQPARPPIRPLGWALMTLGVLLLAGFVVSLAFTHGHHGGAYSAGALPALLILSGWNLRRRPPRDAGRPG